MKIAQIAPIWTAVPPKTYGGIEYIVYLLTEELIKRGHQVTLFAAGGSKTKAKLVKTWPMPLFDEEMHRQPIPWSNNYFSFYHYRKAFLQANKFDIIHTHDNEQLLSNFFIDYIKKPVLITMHNPFPEPADKDRYAMLKDCRHHNFVTLSKKQRTNCSLNVGGTTIYNGIPVDNFTFNLHPKNYVAWLGRFTVIKGAHSAITAAKTAGVDLKLAGTIDLKTNSNKEYWFKQIAPALSKKIEYIGELNFSKKNNFLKNAKALLVPIEWEEPFGLVIVEALACGTPVIAFNRGSVPEIIEDGVNGFIVNDVFEMAKAIKAISTIDRLKCRESVAEKFSVKKMVDAYEKIYHQLIKK